MEALSQIAGKLVSICACAGVVLAVAGCNDTGGSDASGSDSFNPAAENASAAGPLPPGAPSGAVAGLLSRECDTKCTSPDAARRLTVGPVWCFWDGSNVKVHLKLRNPMNASVGLSVTPKYFIEDGGQHGTSFASDIAMKLAAGRGRTFVLNAGHPEGVASGTKIASCAPHLHDIDIG